MDTKLIKVLSKQELRALINRRDTDRLPIHINNGYSKNLKTNLLTPSKNHSYSVCIEFLKEWFLRKFPDDFFKQTYIDMEHILHQRMNYKTRQLLTTNRPALAIKASLDHSYNRELLDQYNYGDSVFSSMARNKDVFFKDSKYSIGIALTMEMLLLNVSFKMLFNEQGIQQDVANRCGLVFRANATSKFYLDIDYHIPDELLQQIVEDTGFFVCPLSGTIVDAENFISYFNQHSQLMLYYKLDSSKNKMQYYLRIPRCYVHIRTNPIEVDEGSSDGNLYNNFRVSFDCQVRFPSPKFYSYLSLKDRSNVTCISNLDNKSFGILVSSPAKIPLINNKGWERKLETMYKFDTKEEIEKIKNKELLSIDFHEMIGDIRDAIELTKSRAINPDVFLDIRLYNYYKEIPCIIDWYKMRIDLQYPISSTDCCIVVYMDTKYYIELINVLKEYNKTRVQPSNTNIYHKYETKRDLSSIPNGKVLDEKPIIKECLLRKE